MIKILNLYAGIGGNRKLWPNDKVVVGLHIFNCAFKEKQKRLI